MMFSADDFRIGSMGELVEFLPILIFVGLVAPFLVLAYTVGFAMDVVGVID